MGKAEIRVDEELLKQVEPILKEMGLTIEKIVELYFKEIIRCGKIPFYRSQTRKPTILIVGWKFDNTVRM